MSHMRAELGVDDITRFNAVKSIMNPARFLFKNSVRENRKIRIGFKSFTI